MSITAWWSVAGTTVPAFVERMHLGEPPGGCRHYGPGVERASAVVNVGVAGTTVPAFVERAPRRRGQRPPPRVGVAGTTVPAFVERPLPSSTMRLHGLTVSPGLRSRPSLSGHQVVPDLQRARRRCRRDYGPGLR